jgi:hypothetical protein
VAHRGPRDAQLNRFIANSLKIARNRRRL